MTIQAPTRISLFGGGTDIAEFSDQWGGVVINMAIDIHQECWSERDVSEYIFYGTNRGLGSSGAFFSAFIAAHSKLNNREFTRDQIAEKAYYLENYVLEKKTGRQDHYASVYGGVNKMEFGKNSVDITPYSKNIGDELSAWIVLVDTKITRERDMQKKMDVTNTQTIESLRAIKYLAYEADILLTLGKFEDLGKLLDRSWAEKKKSNTVSNDKIDALYEKAKKLGALGGKLCGSGGGGYMVFMVPPKKHALFHTEFDCTPFAIDYQGLRIT